VFLFYFILFYLKYFLPSPAQTIVQNSSDDAEVKFGCSKVAVKKGAK